MNRCPAGLGARWSFVLVLAVLGPLAGVRPGAAAAWRVPIDARTIRAALDSLVAPGDTIQLVGNGGSTYPERLVIDRDVTVQGGWRADFQVRDPTIYVSVVRDVTGRFERSVIRVNGSPRVVLDGIWILGGRLAVEATGGADLVLRDCVFRGQRNTQLGFGDQPGGAVHVAGGTLQMEDCRVENVLCAFPGGGLALLGVRSAVIRDCAFQETKTQPFLSGLFDPAPGGGIYAADCPDLLLDGVQFVQTSSQFHWGGAFFASNSTVRAIGCRVDQAYSSIRGGAFHVEDCPSVEIVDCVIENSSGLEGGGLHAERVASLTVTGTRIAGNRAGDKGGGMWIESCSFTLRGNVLDTNNDPATVVPVRGGGVRSLASSGLVEDTTFRGERALGKGGGWFQVGGQVLMRRCVFTGGSSRFFGGGVHIELGGTVRLEQCLLEGNSAKLGGALSASFTGRIEVERCTLTGNSAQSAGASVYLDTAAQGSFWNSILCCAPSGEQVFCSASSADFSHCDVWNDDAVNVRTEFVGSCPDPLGTAGNFRADPAFCDPAGPDYQLSQGSPCVGAASDGGEVGWAGTGCPEPLSLRRESWGSVKARYRTEGR